MNKYVNLWRTKVVVRIRLELGGLNTHLGTTGEPGGLIGEVHFRDTLGSRSTTYPLSSLLCRSLFDPVTPK